MCRMTFAAAAAPSGLLASPRGLAPRLLPAALGTAVHRLDLAREDGTPAHDWRYQFILDTVPRR
jgi:hypothetical protein